MNYPTEQQLEHAGAILAILSSLPINDAIDVLAIALRAISDSSDGRPRERVTIDQAIHTHVARITGRRHLEVVRG